MTKTAIARKYREEYGLEMPTLKLARIMYGKEKLTFKDVEECRTFLRAIEGKSWGKKPPNTLKVENRPKNPYNLPEYCSAIVPPCELSTGGLKQTEEQWQSNTQVKRFV